MDLSKQPAVSVHPRWRHFSLIASHHATPHALLVGVLCLTALVYWPGLYGGFLFDDFPNLEKLGARGPIRSLEMLRHYLGSGFSGPTGRPLSLLTFLVDANDWPADPWSFKRTNLIIHLLVGVTLYATTRQLLLSIGRSRTDASWIGLLAATFWLVNPFLVSTTLYVVQRMTQLATLFVLAGVLCYLHGRALLAKRPALGYALLSVGIPLFTLVALLSKENGALLPLLILVIHSTLERHWTIPPVSRAWVGVFLIVPSLLIVIYLLSRIPGADQSYAARDFTLSERLLSQPRFLWDYVYHLVVPHVQTQGLYQDGRSVSTGLMQPWTTLPALAGLAAGVTGAWVIRRKWPLLSLAVLFFLAGHALESSTVALELYFEHRSYLPAAFLFLPLAAALFDARRSRPLAVPAFAAALVTLYAAATWQHAALWGDEDRLLLVWAAANRESARAQVSAAQVWLKNGRPDQALAVLADASEDVPGSVLLAANTLAFRAELGVLSLAELEGAADLIRNGRFDAQAIRGLEHLVTILNMRGPLPNHARVVNDLLQDVRENLAGTIPPVHRMTLYLQGLLMAGQGHADAAMPYFREALEQLDSVDSGLRMVSELAQLGHYREALDLLGLVEPLLASSGPPAGGSRQTYESEIARLRAALIEDLERQSMGGPAADLP